MSKQATDGPVTVWSPSANWRDSTRIGAFANWLSGHEAETSVSSYADLWQWSIERSDDFWAAVWTFFRVAGDHGVVLPKPEMPGALWFPESNVNYAKYLLEDADPDRTHDDRTAVVAYSETRGEQSLTFAELREQVARARAGLERLGVRPGDRVVGYLPNIPETIIAFLAAASMGAIWAACAPEFGVSGAVDRLGQLNPTVLIGITGYVYGDKRVDRRDELERITERLTTVRAVIHVPYGPFDEGPVGSLSWSSFLSEAADPHYAELDFAHPLYVLFSSGTTGLPKPIMHGHGGILLEHLKNHALSWDLGSEDRFLWYTTTAWMVWNLLVSGLLSRSSIVLFDGNPIYPTSATQWMLIERSEATVVGLSPGYIMGTRADGVSPTQEYELGHVREIVVAGSPLPREGYFWVTQEFPGILLNVGSGGTDVCSGIVQGSFAQSVLAGEISGPCLGVDARAFDEAGNEVVGELGELVICKPMPSMPVGFWGDTDGSAYRAAYFEMYPSVWRHGDWVRFSASGSCVVAGRSDATLNRGGVRLGTAEYYRVVEAIPGVRDSLVVHIEQDGGLGRLLLFVVAETDGVNQELSSQIVRAIRSELSPRHTPDQVISVPSVPRNRSGKKLELPVKRVILGLAPEEILRSGTVVDETSLDAYAEFGRTSGLRTSG